MSSSQQKTKKTKSSLAARNDVVTQIGVPQKYVAIQVSGCSECQSLSVMLDSSCARCDQVDILLCMVAELWEELEGLRSMRESEEEIDWWSCT